MFSKKSFHRRHPQPSTGLTSRTLAVSVFFCSTAFLSSSHFIDFLVDGVVR